MQAMKTVERVIDFTVQRGKYKGQAIVGNGQINISVATPNGVVNLGVYPIPNVDDLHVITRTIQKAVANSPFAMSEGSKTDGIRWIKGKCICEGIVDDMPCQGRIETKAVSNINNSDLDKTPCVITGAVNGQVVFQNKAISNPYSHMNATKQALERELHSVITSKK